MSKFGGSAAGAATGAAVGSVITGVGTVIGGVVGGLIIGLLIDKALLKLKEVYSPDDFRKALVTAISQARAEMKAKLRDGGKRPVSGRQD